MQAPQRMHFRECQKSGMPSRRLRPLSTSTMCSSPSSPRSSEMGSVLSERGSFRTSGEQPQKDAHVFHTRDQLFNADACNMERWHRSPDIGVSFVGADHERARFGDREIAACHARSRGQKPWTRVVSHHFGQKMWVIVMRIGTDGAREHLSYVLPRFVDGGEDNMAGWLAIELLDSFTQIRFDDLDAAPFQKGRHLTLFLEH